MPTLRVVADHREFGSGVPEALRLRQDAVVVAAAVASGDYVIDETLGIERKTGSDFAKSLFDGRLFRQASALKRNYERPILLLEGLAWGQETAGCRLGGAARRDDQLTAVFGLPIIFSSGPEESAELVAIAARQISAAAREDGYVRPGYRPKGWRKRALYLLEGLPGVGPKRASALLAALGSVRGVLTADEAMLGAVPGVGRSVAGAIVKAVGEEVGRAAD